MLASGKLPLPTIVIFFFQPARAGFVLSSARSASIASRHSASALALAAVAGTTSTSNEKAARMSMCFT
jgi:hypothetical protein